LHGREAGSATNSLREPATIVTSIAASRSRRWLLAALGVSTAHASECYSIQNLDQRNYCLADVQAQRSHR
jgi:hypothetical protein